MSGVIAVKKFFLACLMAAAFFTFSAAEAVEINSGGYIEIEHIDYPEQGESLNAARRVAEIMARRALAEQIGELHINSTSTVKQSIDGRELDDRVTASVQKILEGSQVTVTRQPDGSFRAVARLPVFGGNSLANAIMPTNVQVEDFPKPKFTNIESGSLSENYTGLIVNCSGQNLSTAIAPAIKLADGTEIYSFKNIPRQIAVGKGLVAYTESSDSGIQRAGNNPLIIQAQFVDGCDAIVSDEDADKILAANQLSKFLDNCSVVFVR